MATYYSAGLVRSLRLQRGLTQAKLADGICDRRTISYIESGKISPSHYILESLLERLGTDPQRFATFVLGDDGEAFDVSRLKTDIYNTHFDREGIESELAQLEAGPAYRENRFVRQYVLSNRASLLGGWHEWNPDAPYARIFPCWRRPFA